MWEYFLITQEMAINTQSKTTPVWAVFDCSQTYQGYSLNSSWEQGPKLINNLPGILLRFRNDLEAAYGDITTMFYQIRIKEEETWRQIFMWKFAGENKVRLFKMVRLVMGNLMSPSLSGVSLCDTFKMDDNAKKYT